MTVSEQDRKRMARFAADLAALEMDEEPPPDRRAAVVAWANEARTRAHLPPLDEDWWHVPEEEFHRRACALGMVEPTPQRP
ncbi:MAG: hypothetical protein NVS3B21_23720 [Acidimicrobiales bacterium]